MPVDSLNLVNLTASLRTGDAVIFSNNCPTGFILRTLASSQWNHGAVAVRFLRDQNNGWQISLTEAGQLYFLETNTHSRYDDIFAREVVGVGFTNSEWLLQHYNRVAVRRLRCNFRTASLVEKTMEFVRNNYGVPFTAKTLSFFSAWTGLSFHTELECLKNERCEEAFCSQLMATYYLYAVGSQYATLTGQPFDGKLATLFGRQSPSHPIMITPGHFSPDLLPHAPIFENTIQEIYLQHSDIVYVVFQPLILTVFFLLILHYVLQQRTRR